MYRARRDRPELTTDEALRDEVYRRINDPGVKVEKEVSLARPLLAEGVAPPPGRSGAFVTFDDNAMLPTSLQGNGHGHITLRGVERLVDALTTRWRLHPDGAAQLNLVLTQSPHTLLSPRTLVLPTLDGGRREVTLSLDSYGNWRRFTEPTPCGRPRLRGTARTRHRRGHLDPEHEPDHDHEHAEASRRTGSDVPA